MTVVFSDVVGSTDLGERLDAESLHRVMARYFEEVQGVLTLHGGLTEKFIGDAILAVFGIPRAHEDDALRAARAASEMRESVRRLNEGLELEFGVRIRTRTGVNTGEVIAGDPDAGATFVTGDAVNLAARLEQAARPGEILVGGATYELIREFVTAEELPPFDVKGKSGQVHAWRLLEVSPGILRWTPRFDSPLVGRVEDLGVLGDMLDRVARSRTCLAATILGPAGVGKSRLTAEFLATLGEGVTVLRGRCLPYGEGITFWPVVEMLRQVTGTGEFDPPDGVLTALEAVLPPGDESAAAARQLAALMGSPVATPGIHETFWSLRRLFQQIAARGPVVVVFDDIHWGEPTLLDLIEYLRDWLRSAPVLLMCLARPELVEHRTGWMGDEGSATIRLEPLSDAGTSELVQNLLGGDPVAVEIAGQITDTTEGNPLFVEEILRMLVDRGKLVRDDDGRWTIDGDLSARSIPPTIQALLGARVDMLEQGERGVLERAAVIGRIFWWGAVSDLSAQADRPFVGGWLQSLVHKQLIRPERWESEGEDAFRFTHILVRDAAYRGIPKTRRAELHERCALWLQARAPSGTESDEIVGYHLETAHDALSELGPPSDRTRELGRQASELLASAGRVAFARGDMSAAANLLSRAVALLPPEDPAASMLLPDLADALVQTGSFDRARSVLDRLRGTAERSANSVLGAYAIVIELWIRLFTQPQGWGEDVGPMAERAMALFEEQHEDRGRAKGWALLALFHMTEGRFATAADAWRRAADAAAAAGDRREELEDLAWIPVIVWCGPGSVDDSIGACQAVIERSGGDRKATAAAVATLGTLEAMRGRAPEARSLASRAKSILEEAGLPGWAGALTQMFGWTELLSGDAAAAEAELRTGVDILRGIGEMSWLSSTAAILAEALFRQGRTDEADAFVLESEHAAGGGDIYSQGLFRAVRAKILSARGDSEAAVATAREAVAVADHSDFVFLQVMTRTALGNVLDAAHRSDEADPVFSEAAARCDGIGFRVAAEAARSLQRSPGH
ncbi:MAG TPA: adenylate/guanylate cyclase domain-containing protein [Actinomycetota bacterium]